MVTSQLRDRMISALVPACFASDGLFDCPRCGGKGDFHLTVYDNQPPAYLFNLACFCGCEPQEVADEMARRARRRPFSQLSSDGS